jgi:hypothetical protein
MFDSWTRQSLAGLLIAACALVTESALRQSGEQVRVPPGQMPPSFDQDLARVVADLDSTTRHRREILSGETSGTCAQAATAFRLQTRWK